MSEFAFYSLYGGIHYVGKSDCVNKRAIWDTVLHGCRPKKIK